MKKSLATCPSPKGARLSVLWQSATDARGVVGAVDNVPLRAPGPLISCKTTMKMMEELMEELIKFQERYGPGAKARERRAAAAAAAA